MGGGGLYNPAHVPVGVSIKGPCQCQCQLLLDMAPFGYGYGITPACRSACLSGPVLQ